MGILLNQDGHGEEVLLVQRLDGNGVQELRIERIGNRSDGIGGGEPQNDLGHPILAKQLSAGLLLGEHRAARPNPNQFAHGPKRNGQHNQGQQHFKQTQATTRAAPPTVNLEPSVQVHSVGVSI